MLCLGIFIVVITRVSTGAIGCQTAVPVAADEPLISAHEQGKTMALNLKETAGVLGVHYTTAYRYVRTGRLEAEKVGTAWVVDPDVLARFRTETSAPEKPVATRVRVNWSDRLVRALVVGDETAAWRVIEQALASGHTPTDCYLDLITTALRDISSTDHTDDPSREYLAAATVARLVARLGARFRRPGRSCGTIVFGAPVGEMHSLPIAIVADLVRIEGFTCLELGANVPASVFAHAAAHAPRLCAVGIGVTSAANIDAVCSTITAVRAVAPETPILLGGQAVLNPEIASLTGATHWAANGAQALEIVATFRSPAQRRTRHRVL